MARGVRECMRPVARMRTALTPGITAHFIGPQARHSTLLHGLDCDSPLPCNIDVFRRRALSQLLVALLPRVLIPTPILASC
jgi:hypothetical protein